MDCKTDLIEQTIEAFRAAKEDSPVEGEMCIKSFCSAFSQLIHLTELLGSPWLSQLLESQTSKKISILDSAVAWHQGKGREADLRTIRELIDADEPASSPKATLFKAAAPRSAPTIAWITKVCMFVREILVSLGQDIETSVTTAATCAYEGKPLWASHSKVIY